MIYWKQSVLVLKGNFHYKLIVDNYFGDNKLLHF